MTKEEQANVLLVTNLLLDTNWKEEELTDIIEIKDYYDVYINGHLVASTSKKAVSDYELNCK